MSDISVIDINDDVDKIDVDKIDVDKNDVYKNDDEIFTFDNELHNGKPITKIEISPNEKYLITYSNEDYSIVGWNVEDIDKVQLKFHQTVKIDKYAYSLCVSDDKKLFNTDGKINDIIDMNNEDKKISLSDYIYEWNINTEKSVKIFDNSNDKNKIETKKIGIFSNEKFNILKVNDKIIVYSIELGIIIASLDINDDIQLYNFMNHTGLFLLPSFFYYTPDKEIKYCWNSKYKNWFNRLNLIFGKDDEQTDGILNERVQKSKFYENMSKTKVIECDDDDKKTYNHLNVHSFNPYMDTVSTLATTISDRTNKLTESIENLIKWEINSNYTKIKLEVFKKINTEWELISTRIENHPYKSSNGYDLFASSLFNNNDIVILTTFALIILSTLPLYLAICYILSKYNFINDIYTPDVFSGAYFQAVDYVEEFREYIKDITTTPTITFMIPYINFINYSKDYNCGSIIFGIFLI
ncbi:hypothetical protein GLOIN_2v1767492 [Rhizophagus irregularis DAOM 181602=DAOM 197198]|nr:hypothetical protein GLOIN_2v1767492 [Rhizophagus irregularis DAOM 181602=DAOM 197198]